MKYILIKQKHVPQVKVGDMLILTMHVDHSTTLYNSQKVTKINKNGAIRVECINPKCKENKCTYLHLSKTEISKIRVDNRVKKSKRIGGITL